MAGVTNDNARSSAIDALLATTTDKWYKKGRMHDNIFKSNPTFRVLKEANRIEYADGGYNINVNVMYGQNTTVGSYSRYDNLDVSPQDGMTSAIYPWAQYSGALSIDGLSEFQNAGVGRIVKLLSEKWTQTSMTFSEKINEHLWDYENITAPATTANGGKNIQSIPIIVTDDYDTYYPGGINPANYTWWRCKEEDFDTSGATADTYAALLASVEWAYMHASYGTGGPPDLFIVSPATFSNLQEAFMDKRRYIQAGKQKWGFSSIQHQNADIFWDEHVPDISNNVNWDSGSAVDDSIFALNSKFLKLVMARGKDFRPTGFQRPVDQDARTNLYLAYLQLVCSNRRKHCVIHDVTRAIAA